MTQYVAHKKPKSSINQKARTGEYCPKNSKMSQNREKSIQMESKICKVQFPSLFRYFWISGKMIFYEFEGVGNFME